MKRHLFTVASALSLLLCVATVTVWVRSYWVSDFLVYDRVRVSNLQTIEYSLTFVAGRGGFGIVRFWQVGSVRPEAARELTEWADRRSRISFTHEGARALPRRGGTGWSRSLGFAMWNDAYVRGGEQAMIRRLFKVAFVMLLSLGAMVAWASISGCGPTSSGVSATDPYAGFSEAQVLRKFGKPTRSLAGHYGLPPPRFTDLYPNAKTLVYENAFTDTYITLYDKNGTWTECCSQTVEHGAVF